MEIEAETEALHLETKGDGLPVLIFVHGGACCCRDWDAQVSNLSDAFTNVALDLPGHGRSPALARSTVAGFGAVVARVKDRLGRGRAILVGHSLGCRVVLEVYRQSPDGVVGLVCIDGSSFVRNDPEQAVAAIRSRIEAEGARAFLAGAFEQMLTPACPPDERARISAYARDCNADVLAEVLLDTVRWDSTHSLTTLGTVSVPLLLLESTDIGEDMRRRSLRAGMSTNWTEAAATLAPLAEIHIVPDVGHFPHVEAPATVTEALRNFAGRFAS